MSHQTGAAAKWVAAFVLACLGLAGAALAQQPSQAQVSAIRQSCRADYQTYCASVPPGGSASLACLKQNAQSLSPACQRAVNAIGGAAPSAPSQGAAPAPAAPATAGPAPGRPAPPPMTPRQELGLIRRACGPDFHTYCAGVRPGGGRILACLEANGPYLSRQCRSALMSARQGR
jgi:cysteine rich repeat protein